MRRPEIGLALLTAGALFGNALAGGGLAPSEAAPPPAAVGQPAQAGPVGPTCAAWGTGAAVALPSPRRAVGSVRGAGVLVLRYRSGSRWVSRTLTSQMLGRSPQTDGSFGTSVSVIHPSASGCAGLVIGMPGADGGRGAVVVIPDNGRGLDTARAAWLPTQRLALEPGDRLGSAVAPGRDACCTDGMGWSVIAAGVPGRDAPGARDAGAIVTWRVGWAEATSARAPALAPGEPAVHVQGSRGIRGRAEPGDRFGSVLADDDDTLVVGIPAEDVGSQRDAGAVARLTFGMTGAVTGNDLRWQGSGLPGRSRAGDRLGAAVLGPHVGIPGKDVAGRADSGAILFRDSEAGGYRMITQRTRGVPGSPERGDRFGAALAGFLQVGAPGEDVGRLANAGSVTQLSPWSMARSALLKVSGLAAGDRFGATLIHQADECGDGQDVCRFTFIGAPGEDLPRASDAGRYYLLESQSASRSAAPFLDGAAAGEGLGAFRSLTPPPP